MSVTAEEVRRAVLDSGKAWIDHHECGGCGCMVGYSVEQGQLFFHSGCGCSDHYRPEPREWQDAADWINMQTRAEWHNKLRERFGLPAEAA